MNPIVYSVRIFRYSAEWYTQKETQSSNLMPGMELVDEKIPEIPKSSREMNNIHKIKYLMHVPNEKHLVRDDKHFSRD